MKTYLTLEVNSQRLLETSFTKRDGVTSQKSEPHLVCFYLLIMSRMPDFWVVVVVVLVVVVVRVMVVVVVVLVVRAPFSYTAICGAN